MKREALAAKLYYALRDMAKLDHAYWLLATLESRQAHGGACFADFDYLSSEENQRIATPNRTNRPEDIPHDTLILF